MDYPGRSILMEHVCTRRAGLLGRCLFKDDWVGRPLPSLQALVPESHIDEKKGEKRTVEYRICPLARWFPFVRYIFGLKTTLYSCLTGHRVFAIKMGYLHVHIVASSDEVMEIRYY